MAWLPEQPEILPRIVLEHYSQVHLIFIVLLNGFDYGDSPGEGYVENISAFIGTKTDANRPALPPCRERV